jgi:hypothetical protein
MDVSKFVFYDFSLSNSTSVFEKNMKCLRLSVCANNKTPTKAM